MSQPGRDRIRGALGPLWGLALILGWVAPHDHGVVLVCRIGLAVVLVALGGAFIVGWIRARRAGDPTAELHPRAVLALGALLAFGAAGPPRRSPEARARPRGPSWRW